MFLHVASPLLLLGNTSGRRQHPLPDAEREERALTDAPNYLAATIAAYQEGLAGVSTEMDIAVGLTAPMVSSTTRLEHGDLIVMCKHREAGLGQWGIESIAQQTMRRSPVPLLIFNEHGMMPLPDTIHPLRVLIPLDGSLFAEAALKPALHVASRLTVSAPCELCLVRVVEDQGVAYKGAERYLRAISDRLRKDMALGPDFSLTPVIAVGANIAEAVLEQTKEIAHTHLIVLATHNQEGLQRSVLGSIAEDLLEAMTCPLLIICPGSAMAMAAKPGQRAVGKL